MLILHEPAWRVGPDRQHGDIERRKPISDLKENLAVTIAGVAGDIDGADRRCDHIAAPKRHSPVGDAARDYGYAPVGKFRNIHAYYLTKASSGIDKLTDLKVQRENLLGRYKPDASPVRDIADVIDNKRSG